MRLAAGAERGKPFPRHCFANERAPHTRQSCWSVSGSVMTSCPRTQWYGLIWIEGVAGEKDSGGKEPLDPSTLGTEQSVAPWAPGNATSLGETVALKEEES